MDVVGVTFILVKDFTRHDQRVRKAQKDSTLCERETVEIACDKTLLLAEMLDRADAILVVKVGKKDNAIG